MSINPTDRSCFHACGACNRCDDKGRYVQCGSCSGWHDPLVIRKPDRDDRCRCTEGILQLVTRKGQFIQAPYPHNPFKGKIEHEKITEDERDFEQYLQQERERRDDPHWDPVQWEQGGSTHSWTQQANRGA